MSVSADGNRLATAYVDRTVAVWRLADGARLQMIESAHGALGGTALTTNGERLAVGTSDGRAHVFDVRTGEELGFVGRHGDSVNAVRFLDDDRLLTLSSDGTAAVSDCSPCLPFGQALATARARERMHREQGT